MVDIEEYAAFTTDPAGGNPAGVVLDASGLDEARMRAIATGLGHSETAFVTARRGSELAVRYFSPASEVPFCGHATIALAVAEAAVHGPRALRLLTPAGRVDVVTGAGPAGTVSATLTSVAPQLREVAPGDLAEALAALGWDAADLDPALPPRWARAGAGHLVLAARTRERLADLRYDGPRLRDLLLAHEAVTATLVHRRPRPTDAGVDAVLDVRNPFPTGGVVEDPATGAAAAALGGYLRALGLVRAPARVLVHQGADMGRPSVLVVDVPAGDATGVRVTGTAVRMRPSGAPADR